MTAKKMQVKIELTKKCELKCKHCSSWAGNNSKVEVSPSFIDRILLESHLINSVVLTGGEPLLCSHFVDTLEKFNNAGFFPTLYTSGIFDESFTKISPEFLVGKVSKIIVSLHGSEPIHNHITQVYQSFSKAMEFINRINNCNIPFGIHTVALRQNIKILPDLVNYLLQRRISDISILRYVPQGRGVENNIIPPTKEMLRTLYEQVHHVGIRFGAPFNFIREKKVFCKAATHTISIDAFGRVIPCDGFKDVASFDKELSLQYQTISDVINNSPMFCYVRKNKRTKNCNESCLGQFLLQNYNNKDCIRAYA